MDRRRAAFLAGSVLLVAGVLVSFVPTYAPRPGGEPAFTGTLVYAGLVAAIVGAGLVGWSRRGAR